MRIPVDLKQKEITLPRGMAEAIRRRGERLVHFCDRIRRCRITVEGPSEHHRQGFCRVTVDVTLPGGEIVVRKSAANGLESALREAFDAATRCVEDHVHQMRGFVKNHAAS